MNALDDIRALNKDVPIIFAGNKADLERKRNVAQLEVKQAAVQANIPTFEISVALNHEIDDLLLSIIAEIKESLDSSGNLKAKREEVENSGGNQKEIKENDDFQAAIRRFSQRKKKQMGHTGIVEYQNTKCSALNPAGLIERFRQWRKGSVSN
uniref:Ras family protein n=1 Tax=Rhabditophanes sp. KR3021 TaxID=114890 RepID=A0AC35UB97_9BILA